MKICPIFPLCSNQCFFFSNPSPIPSTYFGLVTNRSSSSIGEITDFGRPSASFNSSLLFGLKSSCFFSGICIGEDFSGVGLRGSCFSGTGTLGEVGVDGMRGDGVGGVTVGVEIEGFGVGALPGIESADSVGVFNFSACSLGNKRFFKFVY